MTQVSRHYVSPKVSSQISDMFLSTLTTLDTPILASRFVEDLLSHTERLMLGKRLAIAYMLRKGYAQRDICNVLKVSLGTVSKISGILQTNGNGYVKVIEHMLKQERVQEFFEKLSEKIDKLMPPKGANWSEHYKEQAHRHQKKKKAF